MLNPVYRINSPRVIFENIDGELILVHMEKGTYYSTDQVGAELWSLIEAGCTIPQMCDALGSRYGADRADIESAVTVFLARLADEDLVSAQPSAGAGLIPLGAPPEVRLEFRPPALHAYRDMQDMLALDPIHDVEAAGWPVPRVGDEPTVAPEASA